MTHQRIDAAQIGERDTHVTELARQLQLILALQECQERLDRKREEDFGRVSGRHDVGQSRHFHFGITALVEIEEYVSIAAAQDDGLDRGIGVLESANDVVRT